MPDVRFHGPYLRKRPVILEKKANRKDDPRHCFYEAMLKSDTYEDYYRKVGTLIVYPATYRGPVSAHGEMRYARTDRGWIADR